MKKLITIALILMSLVAKAQTFPKDTTPKFDFFIINTDSNDFRRCERIIYYNLVKNTGMKAATWSDKRQDTITNLFACNVPDENRIVKMVEIAPIWEYMYLLKLEPAKLDYYKAEMLKTSIDADWKWIISNLQYINGNRLRKVE